MSRPSNFSLASYFIKPKPLYKQAASPFWLSAVAQCIVIYAAFTHSGGKALRCLPALIAQLTQPHDFWPERLKFRTLALLGSLPPD